MKKFIHYDNILNYELKIYVGENAQENWKLLDSSTQNSLWFHLDKFSSPHVIVELYDNKKISNTTINYAALLCKTYSKYKNIRNIYVIYTTIKNIKKGSNVGSVITKNTKRVKA